MNNSVYLFQPDEYQELSDIEKQLGEDYSLLQLLKAYMKKKGSMSIEEEVVIAHYFLGYCQVLNQPSK